jgi:hypothetical protein
MYQMLTGSYTHCDKTNFEVLWARLENLDQLEEQKTSRTGKIAELGMAQGFLECQTKSKVTTSSTYKATTGAKKMGFHALSK